MLLARNQAYATSKAYEYGEKFLGSTLGGSMGLKRAEDILRSVSVAARDLANDLAVARTSLEEVTNEVL